MKRSAKITTAVVLLQATFGFGAAAQAEETAWPSLVDDVFHGAKMATDPSVITLDAPYRAEDAALVPITINTPISPDDPRHLVKITLVVDNNPAPVAAEFEVGAKAGLQRIETRVRVNQYTPIHVVAELSDGSFYVAEKFVKASGGCSAPALKDAADAAANAGQMKLKLFPQKEAGGSKLSEAQFMIRHPQNSGMQMDQMSHTYIPAWFINELTIDQGADMIMRVNGGISLSEDPNIRFTYRSNGAAELTAKATDTEARSYQGSWSVSNSGL